MKKQLTDAQVKLVRLDLMKTQIDKYYEELQATLKDVETEIGVEGFFQAEDGTVYQIVKPKGTFVHFRDLDFLRTRRGEERAGSLSAKKAEEAGFTLAVDLIKKS